jgi:molecular chaperone DnaK (HSP70)
VRQTVGLSAPPLPAFAGVPATVRAGVQAHGAGGALHAPLENARSYEACTALRYTDSTVQKDKRLLPFEIVDKDTKPYIEVEVKGETKSFAPEEISAMVLTKMKETSEAFLGKKVANAVVTVPGTRHLCAPPCPANSSACCRTARVPLARVMLARHG